MFTAETKVDVDGIFSIDITKTCNLNEQLAFKFKIFVDKFKDDCF